MDQLTAYQFEISFIISFSILLIIIVFDIITLVRFLYKKINLYRLPLSPLSEPKEIQLKSPSKLVLNTLSFVKKYYPLLFNIILLPLILFFMFGLITPKPQVIKAVPSNNEIYSKYDQPITLTFNVPIQKSKLEAFINPDITGQWDYDSYWNFLPWTRKISFTPQNSLPLDQKIMVYLSYIANEFHAEAGNEYYLEFQSAPLPKVINTYPQNDSTDIPTDLKIGLTLDAIDTKEVAWRFEITPPVEYTIIRTDSEEVFIFLKETLDQGATYTAKVFQTSLIRNLETEEVIEQGEEILASEIHFQTVKAPLVQSISPSGNHIFVDTSISLNFDTQMIPETVENNLIISPAIASTFQWDETSSILVITHSNNFEYATTYEIKLKEGIKSKIGGVLKEDITYTFDTIGPVNVVSSIPSGNSTGVSVNSVITIEFDQDVDRNSAESKFSINPSVNGGFSWNGKVMTFTPNGLNYTTKYTYNLDSGIISTRGQPSTTQITSSFTTSSKTKLLSVPLYSQQESYTCNISATGMMLAYRGVYISEADIKAAIGVNGSRGNGNPHLGFVENYGTYWEPIVAFVRQYRTATIFTNWNLTALLTEVEKGNPVMVWGQNGWSSPLDISWTTADGTYIYAISGMHSYIVKGFVGEKENPSSIIINDPWRGEIYMTSSVFNYRWSFFKTAMVVY